MDEGKQRRNTRCFPGCSTLITALLKVRQSFRAEFLTVSYQIQIVACHPQQRVCSRQRPITRSVGRSVGFAPSAWRTLNHILTDIIPHRRARQIHASAQRYRCDEDVCSGRPPDAAEYHRVCCRPRRRRTKAAFERNRWYERQSDKDWHHCACADCDVLRKTAIATLGPSIRYDQ